jgi:hypothetical protein
MKIKDQSLDFSGIENLREMIEKFKKGGKMGKCPDCGKADCTCEKGEHGIHIKKSHEGLFTKKANAAGQGVQEYARHVLANKDKYPSSTVKQANFARNFGGKK